MTAAALIVNRDAIAGQFQADLPAPFTQLPPIDSTDELDRWEPWVRAAIFDAELNSELGYSVARAGSGGSITLARVGNPSRGPIVRLVRPPKRVFQAQLLLVDQYAALREDRANEILAQLSPPLASWSAIVNLHPARKKKTLELLDVALRFATVVEMRIKHALNCPRPVDYSPQIQPMILTPSHGSLPSGHSTEAHIVAHILAALLPAGANPLWQTQLAKLAERIATNRVIAGVHFPVDSAAGRVLGVTLGEYLLARCQNSRFRARAFRGDQWPTTGTDQDFNPAQDLGTTSRGIQLLGSATRTAPRSAVLGWLWTRACAEW